MISCSHGGHVGAAACAAAAGRHRAAGAIRARVVRIAERPLAGGEEIENDAEREQVAARIVAHAAQLLRRHVGAGADRPVELLGRQVGKLRRGATGRNRSARRRRRRACMMLLGLTSRWMTCWRCRSCSAAATRAPIAATSSQGSGSVVESRLAARCPRSAPSRCRAPSKSPRATKRGTCGPPEPRQDHLLDLEADDGERALAAGERGIFMQRRGSRRRRVRRATGWTCRRRTAIPPRAGSRRSPAPTSSWRVIAQ